MKLKSQNRERKKNDKLTWYVSRKMARNYYKCNNKENSHSPKKFTQKSINFRLHGGKNTNLHGGSLLTYDHVK